TYDGQMMRIYMNGEECGSMARTGPVNPNDFELCLGSFAEKHAAHFTGKLDEVRLYNRALSADEIRAHAQRK
ncbi:MAG: LamG domain-containing protein, partial [Armatimonadota bacterium]